MTVIKHSRTGSVILPLLVVLTVAGLAIDAYVHIDRAPVEPPANGGHMSESALFYAEGVVSIAAALLLLAARQWWAFVVAFVVSASAFAAVMITRYYNIGAVGPIPNTYEPAWYSEKTLAAVAEGLAAVAALMGGLLLRSLSAQREATGKK